MISRLQSGFNARLYRCAPQRIAPDLRASSATASPPATEFEAVIGIETHVQLMTKSKAFCRCHAAYGSEANSNICPVCMGHPGALPVLNAEMATLAVRAGLALNAKIRPTSKFDRKQYFYADLPKGYQISQYDEPVCEGGYVESLMVDGSKKRFGVTRAHLVGGCIVGVEQCDVRMGMNSRRPKLIII